MSSEIEYWIKKIFDINMEFNGKIPELSPNEQLSAPIYENPFGTIGVNESGVIPTFYQRGNLSIATLNHEYVSKVGELISKLHDIYQVHIVFLNKKSYDGVVQFAIEFQYGGFLNIYIAPRVDDRNKDNVGTHISPPIKIEWLGAE